jgi:EpsD family peptidyl-prolyl cis-trans isomerase
MKTNLPHSFVTVLLIFLAFFFSGCGKEEPESKIKTQVAVKVNSDEISVHQINFAMQRLGKVPEQQIKQANGQVLEKLIDEQLLVQKAVEKKLDRDPRVVQAIETAKRQILSQAYLEQVIAAVPNSAESEIKEFYDKRPELFGERRIYRFHEVSFQAKPEIVDQLGARVKAAKTIAEITTWLGEQKIGFNVSSATKAAEQLPLAVLPALHKMKDGAMELIVNQSKTNFLVIQLAASQSSPMDDKASRPYIEQFLRNKKRGESAESEVKQLRTAAKIEYQGDFIKTSAEATAPKASVATSGAESVVNTKPGELATEQQDVINKGLSDLK